MISRTLLIFTILVAASCNSTSSTKKISSQTAAINAFLQDIVDRQQLVGLSVAATRNDSLVYTHAFGVKNLTTGEPLKPSNFFHWASVSKTFVATAVLQLVEKGKIRLDEKLITYLPYFKHKGEEYKTITIRQMLNHTSGIGDVDDYEWDKPQNDDGAPERFVKGLASDTLKFAPGKDWAYSNTAFEILGVIITKVSGVPFETYVKENILTPLAMEQSSFIYPEIPDSLRVNGHVWAGKAKVSSVYPYNKIHAPSSTMNSNVLEMSHYAIANLHRGKYGNARILNDSTYDILWTNSVNQKEKPAVGAAWFAGEHHGLKIICHAGGDTGFRSFLLLVPEKNISVMLASNYELCNSYDIAMAVLDLMTGKHPDTLKQQIGFRFSEIMMRDGEEAASAFYKKINEDSVQRNYYLWKEDDGALTYPAHLLSKNNLNNEAVAVLKLNLALNPASGDAYGNLGVALAKTGDKAAGRENLRKAIQLLPTVTYYKDELKKIE